jgi:hypothetical protein
MSEKNVTISGVDPSDGKLWDIRVSHQRMDLVAKRGIGPAKELAHIVRETLNSPTAIFQGIREEGESEWLCYCGLPSHAYHRISGDRILPHEGEVFLVFVNADRVAYNWRWEKCDPRDPKFPMDYDQPSEKPRFRERLL